MMIRLYEICHGSWGMCFWTPFALLVGVLMIVVVLVHCRNQKKREKDFCEENARTQQIPVEFDE